MNARHDMEPRRPQGRRSLLLRTAPALLLVAALGACGGREPEVSDLPPTVVRAPTASAQQVSLPREVELYGTVEADRTAAVSARVMAMVTAVHVQAGDHVRKGELLLEIDPQAARGQLSQAQGALAQARAALALAERNYERFKALAASNAASELELDMARMQYEQAKGAVEQGEGAVSAASSVAADSRVTAPFAGRVAERLVEVGDLTAPGRPLMRLQSETSRRVALAVPESVMAQAKLALGSPLAIAVDSRPDLGELRGTVVEMTPGADPMSHSFLVKAEVPGGEGGSELPTGAAARGRVPLGERPAVVAPAKAVIHQGGLTLVVTRGDDGTANTRVVTLGRTLGDGRVEVLSGLTGGETLLLDLATAPPAGAVVESPAMQPSEGGGTR